MRQAWICLVLALAAASAANAQQTLRRFEIGAQTTMLEALGQTDGCSMCLGTHWSAGPAATFNISRHFAIDGAVTVFRGPAGNPSWQVGGHLTQAVVGLKVSARSPRLALFVNVRPGIVRWSQGQVTNLAYPGGLGGPEVYSYAPRTNFGVEFGGGVEYAISSRFAVRAEMGDMATVWHRYKDNVWDPPYDMGESTKGHFYAGVFYRFGTPIPMNTTPEPTHKFLDKTNVALFSASLLAYTAGAIATQRGLANCRKLSPYPDDPVRGCAQLEKNVFARPLVSRGWGGQIAFSTLVNGGQILVSYALHRMGHHRMERLVPAINTAGEAAAAYNNFQSSSLP